MIVAKKEDDILNLSDADRYLRNTAWADRLCANEALMKLRFKKFPIGSDGFIALVDVMGDDQAICQAARVSYGEGTKTISDDRGLLRYLMRHRHSTPYEMCEVKFLVRVSMDTWRQWIRHRTANVNEYSTRYSLAIDSAQEVERWRLQADSNKQGSKDGELQWPPGYEVIPYGPVQNHSEFVVSVPGTGTDSYVGFDHEPTPSEYLSKVEGRLLGIAREGYDERILFGVAREQARKDLPLSTYTEAYWKCDLHNIFHFLGLRMDAHAQQEVRDYADVMGNEIIAKLFPLAWEAFVDYRLNSATVTQASFQVMQALNIEGTKEGGQLAKSIGMSMSEFNECIAAGLKLGFKMVYKVDKDEWATF
jgi:thymidylate synthase (FAD)